MRERRTSTEMSMTVRSAAPAFNGRVIENSRKRMKIFIPDITFFFMKTSV
jgi:hypothetical protein